MNRQFGGFLLAAMMVIAGCGGADRRADVGAGGADQTPVQGDWLVLAYDAEADKINPITSNNAYTGYIWGGAMGSMVGEYLLG